MGLFSDVFSPKQAERDRYNNLLKQKRQEYPKLSFGVDEWRKESGAKKIEKCQDLGVSVAELRLLKEGKIGDAMLSDGHRVDERGKKVYSEIYKEYNDVYKRRFCDPILQTVTVNKDILETKRNADILQSEIEKDTDEQRKIIIAVGGVVLLLGTIIILRKAR